MEKDITNSTLYKNLCIKLQNLMLKNKTQSQESREKNPMLQIDIVRKQYSDSSVLLQIIKSCLSSYELCFQANGEETSRDKALQELREAVTLIELQSCLLPPSLIKDGELFRVKKDEAEDSELALFGLQQHTLRDKAKKMVSVKRTGILREEVQNSLVKDCNQIISFTFPEETFPPSDGMSAVVHRVSDLLENLDAERRLLAKQRQYNSSLLKMVYQQLTEYGCGLESLVKKYRFSSHLEPHLNFILLSFKVYLMKLRCLEKEVLTSTYSKSSIPVLKSMKKDIDKAHKDAAKSLAHVNHKLDTYRGLDPRFHLLLQEYSNLQKDFQFFTKTS